MALHVSNFAIAALVSPKHFVRTKPQRTAEIRMSVGALAGRAPAESHETVHAILVEQEFRGSP